MTTIEPLPRSYLDARRLADPSIRMRVVTRGDAAELPEDPHELVPGAWSRGAMAAAVLGTALITVGFAVGMWFVATNPPPGSGTGWFIGWNLFPWFSPSP
ncbi:hypothetical protein [Occultella kanbiaonis]|uniref:hypothetical protein n=1 Tax=Occultella kanbiaonis TaxID=2675754 RepID=UPI0012B8E41E|nr:hypothetical protein [Occultella kanbiaonis]